MQGTVKFFDEDRGFGFITPADGSRDVFVHIRAVQKAGAYVLSEGQKVSFEVVTDPKTGKPASGNIQVVR
jgi:cold shock protein